MIVHELSVSVGLYEIVGVVHGAARGHVDLVAKGIPVDREPLVHHKHGLLAGLKIQDANAQEVPGALEKEETLATDVELAK
jgi:hypothetical protein